MALGVELQAQHSPLVSHYMLNSLPLNPAFAGSRDALNVTINYRKQWVGFDTSPSTGTLSLHTPSKNTNLGYGLLFINDQLGVSRETGFMGNVAYQLKTSRGKLNFGLAGGLFNYTNKWSEINTAENSDEVFLSGDQSFWGVNFSTGLYYYERNLYISLSAPFILSNQYRKRATVETSTYKSPGDQNIFLTGGYKFETRSNFDFTPSVMIKYLPGSPLQMDFNFIAEYNKQISAGVTYRPKEALIGILKYNISPKLTIGYGVDFALNDISNFNKGSHEISLVFDMVNNTNAKSTKFF